jgi:hypothetical protein
MPPKLEEPPIVEFDHKGSDWTSRTIAQHSLAGSASEPGRGDIEVHDGGTLGMRPVGMPKSRLCLDELQAMRHGEIVVFMPLFFAFVWLVFFAAFVIGVAFIVDVLQLKINERVKLRETHHQVVDRHARFHA